MSIPQRTLRHLVPSRARTYLGRSPTVSRLRYFGSAHYCPLCRSPLRVFRPLRYERVIPYWDEMGVPTTKYGICPVCRSEGRHRLYWEFLKQSTDLFDGRVKRMLHIAPEQMLVAALPESSQPGLRHRGSRCVEGERHDGDGHHRHPVSRRDVLGDLLQSRPGARDRRQTRHAGTVPRTQIRRMGSAASTHLRRDDIRRSFSHRPDRAATTLRTG